MSIDDRDDRVEHTLNKLADSTKVGGTVCVLEDRVALKRNVDRLETS